MTQPVLALSRFMDRYADRALLEPEIAQVEAVGACTDQTDLRWWEYAMALKAIETWQAESTRPVLETLAIADVGGAGSTFYQALQRLTPEPILLVDPRYAELPAPIGDTFTVGDSLETLLAASPSPTCMDVLTCISVLEHLPQVRPFLRACTQLLKPGGLLFLTVDAWDCEGSDTAHFHWMRERIYHKESLQRLMEDLRLLGMKTFGGTDWHYPGNQLYGSYTFASVAMIKKTPDSAGGRTCPDPLP